jgi:uncharacterized tellurite resistance protein B-like protein
MTRAQILILSKLLVSFGWVDKELHSKEVELVNELLQDDMVISLEDKREVYLYMEYPLSPAEVKHLINCFKREFSDETLHKNVLAWVKRMILADGKVRESEEQYFDRLEAELKEPPVNDSFSSSFAEGKTRSPFAHQVALGRDRHLDDYINNPVYFKVYRYLMVNEIRVSVNKQKLRMLCLVSTLLAHVFCRLEKHNVEEFKKYCETSPGWSDLPLSISEVVLNEAYYMSDDLYAPKKHCTRLCKFMDVESRKELALLLFKMVKEKSNNPVLLKEVEEIATDLSMGEFFVYEQTH